MPQFIAAQLKLHLGGIPNDFTEHDHLIMDYAAAAENWIQEYLRRDLDAELDGVWPHACRQAIRLLVADYYQHRGATVIGASVHVLPIVKDMLAPFRNFNNLPADEDSLPADEGLE